jgi:hypothetical protein
MSQTAAPTATPARRAGYLAAQGYRFLRRNGVFAWAIPEVVGTDAPDFLDCTDLDDAAFERAVRETEARRAAVVAALGVA